MIDQYPLAELEGPYDDKKFVFMYLDSLKKRNDIDKLVLIDDGNVLTIKEPEEKEPEEVLVKKIKI